MPQRGRVRWLFGICVTPGPASGRRVCEASHQRRAGSQGDSGHEEEDEGVDEPPVDARLVDQFELA